MREKQIAVITLLDVKTELPRYPSFGLGIGNIHPPTPLHTANFSVLGWKVNPQWTVLWGGGGHK